MIADRGRWSSFGRAVVATVALAGCRDSEPPPEPPLRPLLSTEALRGVDPTVPGYEEWVDRNRDPVAWPTEFATSLAGAADEVGGPAMSPEALVLDVFAAMTSGDVRRLEVHTFAPDALAVASRMGADTATATATEIRDDALATLRTLAPREGSRTVVYQPGQVTIGRPRSVDGALARSPEDGVMHWGNELSFGIRGTTLEFTLRFPNLLVDADGFWRMRAAPVVDARFRAWRDMGMDLMPEMMDTEHSPLPLEVGNYWHYRTRRPGPGDVDGEAGALTRNGYRDSVVEVAEHDGYRVVRFRRVYDDPTRSSERFAVLITASRVYACGSECIRRASDVSWVLDFGQRNTPTYVFPVPRGGGWSIGGADRADNTVRVLPDPVAIEVPAGVFSDAYEISRSTSAGREASYFVPGIGLVARHTRSTLETTIEELIDFRILP